MSKQNWKDLRRKGAFRHSFDQLFELLDNGDDRVFAIVAFAALDDMLGGLLAFFSKKRFLGTHKDWFTAAQKLLFAPEAPLSSASSRINSCYVFGLIDQDLYRILDKARDIRNCAAHFAGAFSMDSEIVQSLKDSFSDESKRLIALIDSALEKGQFDPNPHRVSPRQYFRASFLLAYLKLMSQLVAMQKGEPTVRPQSIEKDLRDLLEHLMRPRAK